MTEAFIIGWEEWLALPDLGLPAIKAKIDTGARTSALHAHLIEPFGPADTPLVRFAVHPIAGRTDLEVTCLAPLIDRPEGTSSNGHQVLPFKSSLLEPVCASNHPLSVAHISYELDKGSVENDVCYWGGMNFLPPVLRLMTLKSIRAHIRIAPIVNRAADRKELARQLHAEIVRLKATATDDKP